MFWVKVPRYMKDGNLRLRPLRVLDGPFISKGLRDENLLTANTEDNLFDSSWISIWWMIKTDNQPALSFWKGIGFTQVKKDSGTIHMSMDLNHSIQPD